MQQQASVNMDSALVIMRQNEVAQGMRHSMSIRDGFALKMFDLQYTDDIEFVHAGGEYLKFHYKLAGNSAIRPEKDEYVPVEAGNVSFLVQPKDSLKYEMVKRDTHERYVTLVCTREFASGFLPQSSANLPTEVCEYLRDRTSRFTLISRPLLPSMRAMVEDILNPGVTEGLRSMMIEAKALELLCATVQQILDVPLGTASVPSRARAKVRDLCAILEADPGANLSMTALCRLVAWNETQMMDTFKLVTGTTISSYRHRVRMDNAKRQLLETDVSITEIAFDAGYEHPCNFTTAFKRTFGYPPKRTRARYS